MTEPPDDEDKKQRQPNQDYVEWWKSWTPLKEPPSRRKRFTRALKTLPKKIIGVPRGIKKAVLDYEASYKRGVEKFGVWWKVFNWSIWAFIVIFLVTAASILIFVLPQLEVVKYL